MRILNLFMAKTCKNTIISSADFRNPNHDVERPEVVKACIEKAGVEDGGARNQRGLWM